MAEMRSVGKLYRYSIKPGAGGWSEDLWKNVVSQEYRIALQEVLDSLLPALQSGRMTEAEFDLRGFHEVWTRVANRTGLKYERTAW